MEITVRRVLAIIPTYNEADNIGKLILSIFEIGKTLVDWKLEILVVDDNSPDGTATIVKGLQATFGAQLKLLQGQKAGLGRAYLRGFEEGLRTDTTVAYDAFVMMDADFSHDPAVIPQLLRAIDDGADYVIGSRYVQGGSIPGNWPLLRILNSRVANGIARLLTDIDENITDMTGGYKAININALRRIDLSLIHASGYVFQLSLLHAFIRSNATVKEIPIVFTDRQYGQSKLKVSDIFEFIYRAYHLNSQSRVATLIKFCLVGFCGSIVNIAVLSAFVHLTTIPILLAVIVAIEVSIISNFFMNHFFTFKQQQVNMNDESNNSLVARLLKFNTGALGGAVISLLVFALLHNVVHMHYIFADICAILLAVSWNYWMSTKFVWKTVNAGY